MKPKDNHTSFTSLLGVMKHRVPSLDSRPSALSDPSTMKSACVGRAECIRIEKGIAQVLPFLCDLMVMLCAYISKERGEEGLENAMSICGGGQCQLGEGKCATCLTKVFRIKWTW